MEKIEGLFTAITTAIRERENDDKLVISVDDMVAQLRGDVDFDSVPKEVLADYVLRYAVAIGLNDNGYRSVVKGEGLYVNLEDCKNPDFIARLFNNAMIEEKAKEQVVNVIRKEIEASNVKQFAFDIDGMIFEEMTAEQLLELLRGGT